MNQDMSNKIITYLNASQKVSQRAGRIVPLLLLFLMLIFGDVNVWGQKNKDFSGTYYIANHNRKGTSGYDGYDPSDMTKNFYLRPSTDTYDEEGNQPFLTTKKDRTNDTPSPDVAKWTIKFAKTEGNTDYYYLIHSSKKYLTWHDKMSIGGGANATDRVRLHLQSTLNEENALFYFTEGNKGDNDYNICLKEVYCSKSSIGSLNPAKDNKDNAEGVSISGAGTVTVGSKTIQCGGLIGIYEQNDATGVWYLEEAIDRPTFTSTSSQIVIEHSAGNNATIYYTIDGTNPTTTNHTGSGEAPLQIDMPENAVTLKAIAVIDDLPSCISSIRVVPAATITLAETTLTYNGSAQTIGVTSVMDGETPINDEFTVRYSNNTNAGTATVNIEDKEGGNYIVYGSKSFIINKKDLTVTANPKTITYGEEPTNDGVIYSGFVNSETSAVLGGTLDYDYSYVQYSDVGNTYTITPSGLTSSNYDISFEAGTLTVDQREIGLTWSETTSFPYDGLEHAPTAIVTGLVNNDEVGVTVSGVQTNAGNYTATASALTGEKAVNYKLPTEKTHAFTITPVELMVKAKNHIITYGDVPAGNGVTYEGFVNSETESVLGGSLDYDYSYSQYDDVGNTYTITPKGLTSTNYDITFTPGVLTVTPKMIGVEWTDTELSYNGSEQAPTATATGLVNSDEVGVTVTGAQTNVGTDYIATAFALTGEKKDNYQLPEGLTHTFTITPKSIGDGNKAADDIIIELSPEGELSVVKQGEKILVEDTDYTQETEVDGDDKIITITGMGNYTGSVKALFANPVFTDPDGTGSEKAAAVYTASRDLSAPAGIEPYIVRKVNPSIGTLVISKLDYIPEDVPVLLLSNAESEGFVASPKDPSIPEVTVQTKNSNQLKVSHGGETVEAAQIYMFYKGEFVLTKTGTMGKGKYYLYNPNFKVTPSEDDEEEEQGGSESRSVLRIVIEEENTTEIDDVRSKVADVRGDWYTLDGRRLSGKPTKSGIYIRKGQKVFIKRK